jgi:hypothetical protein
LVELHEERWEPRVLKGRLEAVYLPLDLSIAPMLFYCGNHCFIVALDAGAEALEFRDIWCYASCQTGLQGGGILVLEDLAELLRKVFGDGDLRMNVVTASTQRWSSRLRCFGGLVSQNATSRRLGRVLPGFEDAGVEFAREGCKYSLTRLRCPL